MIPQHGGTEQGSYCASCNKVVRDFSNDTEEEIVKYLLERRGEKVCGRFRNEHVVPNVKLGFSFDLIPNFISPLKKFAIAAMLVFGSALFTITTAKGQNVTSFQIQLDSQTLSMDYHVIPMVFNKRALDSIMSKYDSLRAMLVPIPYNDIDTTAYADLPPIPYQWEVPKVNLADSIQGYFVNVSFTTGVCALPTNPGYVWGDMWVPSSNPEPLIPIAATDPILSDVSNDWPSCESDVPRTFDKHLENSHLTEEKQKEGEENDRKRDHPKPKTNDDLIDDSDFPSLRKRKS